MDVQTENTDPPPCESQSSGKIRKGFKLFGKRKPGNIFSIRNKGDGNNKSPVNKSKTLDGLSETGAPHSESEPDKNRGQEVSQGEIEQAEEEALGEDAVQAFTHGRNSISSVCSARSLSFLSLLRGGRRGTGGRQVHTVSQPAGRQRRGLKGLFGNVKLRSNEKDEKEGAPPSPLLMSSRANSVEIIKEDLTLTPKSQPRSLDSPEMKNCEPVESLSTQDSTATTPSETVTPQVTTGNVSKTNEHVPPLSTPEQPLVPGDNSLSSLLADISSLLTFDSITGGGDIMAVVEAEWGKVSSSISTVVTDTVTSKSRSLFSEPSNSSPLNSTSVSSATMTKPSPVAVPAVASIQSVTPLTTTSSTLSAKPSIINTHLNKSSNLSTHSDSPPVSESSTSIIKSTITLTTGTPLSAPATITTISSTTTSSPLMTIKSTPNSTSAATAPPITSATIFTAPSVSPSINSSVSILASETVAPPKMVPSVIKPSPVDTPTSPAPSKTPPVTHSPPVSVALTQPLPAKTDLVSNVNLQTPTSYKPTLSSAAEESKAPVTVSPACTVSLKSSSPATVITATMTPIPSSTITSGSVSVAPSKPLLTSTKIDLNHTPPSLVTVPHLCPPSPVTATIKMQPSPASVPTPSSASLDKTPPMTKETVQVSIDKILASTVSAPTTNAVVATASQTPPAPARIQISQDKAPLASTQIQNSVSKESSAQVETSQSKDLPCPAQIPSKDPVAPVNLPLSVSTAPPEPVFTPISVSKDSPAPVQTSVSQSKAPLAPTSPPAPSPVPSLPSTPAPWSSEVSGSEKIRGNGQTSVDGHLASLSSTGPQGAQTTQCRQDELHNEPTINLQGPSKERKTPHAKAAGLSKIPVVGGGRAGKLPVRESPYVEDEACQLPPTPELEEERPHFNSHHVGSKDKTNHVEAIMLTPKLTKDERQQPKVFTSLPRDSKIPVKHGAQSPTTSQIPQAKELPRTKIPVSKVPVRRVGNKPAAGSGQMRK